MYWTIWFIQIGDPSTGVPFVFFVARTHIGLSVLVFYAVNRPGKMYFFPIAVFLHALADFPVGLYQTGILGSMPLTEAAVFAGALIIFGIASVVYKRMDS